MKKNIIFVTVNLVSYLLGQKPRIEKHKLFDMPWQNSCSYYKIRGFFRLLISHGIKLSRAGLTTILKILLFSLLVPAVMANTALAQCNSSRNTGTLAPINRTETGTLNSYQLNSIGIEGCNGANKQTGNGGTGFPGTPTTDLSVDLTNVTITGSASTPFTKPSAVTVFSIGGNGGTGGTGGNQDGNTGGMGGTSGVAGSATLNFNGDIENNPDLGIAVFSDSIIAGHGAAADNAMIWAKQGGNGGIGAAGADAVASANLVGNIKATQGAWVQAAGGSGGNGAFQDADFLVRGNIFGGNGGAGNTAGAATLIFSSGTLTTTDFSLFANAFGGTGGNGGNTGPSASEQGGNGGQGGTGGVASINIGGDVVSNSQNFDTKFSPPPAVFASANGGNGGRGGSTDNGLGAAGGSGANGGNGGNAKVTIETSGQVTLDLHNPQVKGQANWVGHAVLVSSKGGAGGLGGNSSAFEGRSGNGGDAGSGGSATFEHNGTINTNGSYVHGALIQSVGGGGGSAGIASGWFQQGGQGRNGGNGGSVSVKTKGGQVTVTGDGSIPIVAQSIGGNGGTGGSLLDTNVGAQIAIGGNGGSGGNGGTVTMDLNGGVLSSLNGLGGSGIGFSGSGAFAQSVGGAGGLAGSAVSQGVGLLGYTIGGDGGDGGTADNVTITSSALVTTYGDHASGLEAQSVGGGGGKGGSTLSFTLGLVPTASVAVGGKGGNGGVAGVVNVSNNFQIYTSGPDASGVLAQSISGGGGHGGTAAATAVSLAGVADVPAISLAVAIGAEGGSGGTGNTVVIDNAGLVMTGGHGSAALMAQSVGGGGGKGGDSSASSFSGGAGNANVSIDVAVGGSGTSGGSGGAMTVTNAGLLLTYGQDAFGVHAQSVGAGGGSGSGGDAAASSASAGKLSFATNISVGGHGGSGGFGGFINASNEAGIATWGDGSDGIFIQSVGGGGGQAGGGVGNANGGTLSVSVSLGGDGGNGGNGGEIKVTNSGGIVTNGVDSLGLSAQSIGGGGGRAGKGGATAGGAPAVPAVTLAETIANGLNLGEQTKKVDDGVVLIGNGILKAVTQAEKLEKIVGPVRVGKGSSFLSPSINISVGVGGKGGAAGEGGLVKINNLGEIVTGGAQADGMFAQSTGGGGGMGGAATATSATQSATTAQASVSVGGNGGSGGNGDDASATNGRGALVQTAGVSAFGMVAQSVGGGGGRGTMAFAVSKSLPSVSVNIGGASNVTGNGANIAISNFGSVITTGKHAIGMLGQSVGGGGGLVKVISNDQTGNQANNSIKAQSDVFGINLSFGSNGSGAGTGGTVLANLSGGRVSTSGRNGHGIVAQSVGGGGGLATGGVAKGSDFFFGGKGGSGGNGGMVTVNVNSKGSVATTGDGAVGIWAQTTGGGGGTGGDIAAGGMIDGFVTDGGDTVSANNGNSGDGGVVIVDLKEATITTTGNNSFGVFAQSLGGGGGYVATDSAPVIGSAGGNGNGNTISISLIGAKVSATGDGASGIFAESDGKASDAITITLDATSNVIGGSAVSGGRNASAIRIRGGTGNVIDNAGTITGTGTGNAILVVTSGGTILKNSGTINGSVVGAIGFINTENTANGLLNMGAQFDTGVAGVLNNHGTISVGGVGHVSHSLLTGKLLQSESGKLLIDMDTSDAGSDLLEIIGTAELVGRVEVNPISLRKSTVTVLTASDGIMADSAFDAESTLLFSFTPRIKETTLEINTDADFLPSTANLSGGRDSLGKHLQTLWDQDASGFGGGFAALAAVSNEADYERTLDLVSGRSLHAISAWRYEASQRFARSGFSCQTFEGDSLLLVENNCSWGRVEGSYFEQDRNGSNPGFNWWAVTTMIGGQMEFQPGWFLGGAIGYEKSDLSADAGLTDVDSDAILGAVTLKYISGPLQLASTWDFGYGWNDSTRQIYLGDEQLTAEASPNSFNTGLHLRMAWQFMSDNVYALPGLELDVNYGSLEGYTESGGESFNLTVDDSDNVVFSATPIVKVGGRIDFEDGTLLNLYASTGVTFLSGNSWDVNARFTDAPGSVGGFQSQLQTDKVVGRFSAGVEVITTNSLSIRAQYDAGISENQASHSGQLKLNLLF